MPARSPRPAPPATPATIGATGAPAEVISILALKAHCSTCSLRELCLPVGLDANDMKLVDATVRRRTRLRKGETLYRAGQPFSALYAIRLGTLKTTVLSEDGRNQVAGYHLQGDLVGLDGLGTERHGCEAVALEDSEVCAIPFCELEELARSVPALQRNLHQLLAREISRDHGVMLVLGSMRAEERLASFLLNLSRRYQLRGYSSTEFVLRMTREEIGSYLGLKLETVSRIFSKFQEEGFISVQQKHIRILNVDGLKALLGQRE